MHYMPSKQPLLEDHLSTKTPFSGSLGWSLCTGSTVLAYRVKSVLSDHYWTPLHYSQGPLYNDLPVHFIRPAIPGPLDGLFLHCQVVRTVLI